MAGRVILAALSLAWGQARGQDISNVTVQRDDTQKQILIIYDLTDSRTEASDVVLQMSNDDGKSWELEPKSGSLRGDVGQGIQPGKGKKILWNAGEDYAGLPVEGFLARISIERIISSASSGDSAPAAQPTESGQALEQENQSELEKSRSLPASVIGKDGAVRLLIPAGYFTMGAPLGQGEKDERPRHQVWVSALYMDEKLVTYDRYDKFCEATGREKPVDSYIQYKNQLHWGRGQRPVLSITWREAGAYCKWAGGRLPTEAEWEKAARGGTDTAYFWGNEGGKGDDYACFGDISRHQTFPVGELKPNPYGLYDIVGNLWEWVSDWYGGNYYAESPERNPLGPETGTQKVLRGGSFANGLDCLRVAQRAKWDPDKEDGFVELAGHVFEHGCRCVQTP